MTAKVTLDDHNDRLILYDGRTANWNRVISFYGFQYTDTITSPGNTVLVVFRTDDLENTGGFVIHWTFVRSDGEHIQ